MTFPRKRIAIMPPSTVRGLLLLLTCTLLLLFSHHFGPELHSESTDIPSNTRVLQSSTATSDRLPIRVDRHAFFLQVSKPTLSHLPRLLDRIWHPDNIYAVHFDSVIHPSAAQRALLASNLSVSGRLPTNIHTMPQEAVNYRGVSMLLNIISAMQFLLDIDSSWRYFINLSASDYPLISPRLLRELLAHTGPSHNFFSFSSADKAVLMLRNRMTEFHVDHALAFQTDKRPVTTVHAQNPIVDQLAFQPSYAEAWMINSRNFCQYVVSSPVARKTLVTLAYSLSSPEHYFATLARNDATLNASVVPHSMRLILWSFRGKQADQHPFYLDELSDIDDFMRKSPLFFARKFKQPNSRLMDVIDIWRDNPAHVAEVRQHFYHKIKT